MSNIRNKFAAVVITLSLCCSTQSQGLRTPDTRYYAERISQGGSVHFNVVETATNRVVLTTSAKYSTPNDVKVGLFSKDSKRFAAAYHYSGPMTWIGLWSLESGKLLRAVERNGWIREISDVVEEK